MDSSVAPADCSHASSFRGWQVQDSTIYLTRGPCAISESDRKQIDSGFLRRKMATANDSMAHGSLWSAPVEEIPPGSSAKFHIFLHDRLVEAFVINFRGHHYAYVNHCAHAGTPLDWWPNEFFSDDGQVLVCGTHGARYEPATGRCAGGPCKGGRLSPLHARIVEGQIVVTATEIPNSVEGSSSDD
jgi:nitrite reductase/ring-hydroxylating ferredoxin subunit